MGNRREAAVCADEPFGDFPCPLQVRKLRTQTSQFPLQETELSGKGLDLNIGLSASETCNCFSLQCHYVLAKCCHYLL